MNREIKFRAFLWSDEHTNDQMIFSDEVGMLNFWSNYLRWQGKKAIMQYTGLKDKNGKEIYEGDIVKITETTDGKDVLALIHWKEKEACFGWKLNFLCMLSEKDLDSNNWEVIGNIYENPELINEVEK